MRTDIIPIPAGAVYRVASDASPEQARGLAANMGLRLVVYGSERWLAQPAGTESAKVVSLRGAAGPVYDAADHPHDYEQAEEVSNRWRARLAQRPGIAQQTWWRRAIAALRRPISIY